MKIENPTKFLWLKIFAKNFLVDERRAQIIQCPALKAWDQFLKIL